MADEKTDAERAAEERFAHWPKPEVGDPDPDYSEMHAKWQDAEADMQRAAFVAGAAWQAEQQRPVLTREQAISRLRENLEGWPERWISDAVDALLAHGDVPADRVTVAPEVRATALAAIHDQPVGRRYSTAEVKEIVYPLVEALDSGAVTVTPDRETLLIGLQTAMLGTIDGDLIDPDSEIPAGEMYRLAGEYLESVLASGVLGVPADQIRAEAWDEGATAYRTRHERDESLPLTNPHRKAAGA